MNNTIENQTLSWRDLNAEEVYFNPTIDIEKAYDLAKNQEVRSQSWLQDQATLRGLSINVLNKDPLLDQRGINERYILALKTGQYGRPSRCGARRFLEAFADYRKLTAGRRDEFIEQNLLQLAQLWEEVS